MTVALLRHFFLIRAYQKETFDSLSMDLLDKLTKNKKAQIVSFLQSNLKKLVVNELGHIKWVAQAMHLVGDINFQKLSDKKKLVVGLYEQLAADPNNGFKGTFDIGEAVEFVWDTYNQKYGLTLKKKGWLSCLPGCVRCSCLYDVDDRVLTVATEDATAEEEAEVEIPAPTAVEEEKSTPLT